MSRRLWVRAAIYLVLLLALVGGRGYMLAQALGGRYPPAELAFDVAALGLIIVGLRLFDAGMKRGLARLIPQDTRLRRGTTRTLHALIVLGVGFPFLLVTLQFHPQRIAPGGTPKNVGLDYRDVAFTADGLRLSGWFIPAREPRRPVVLVAHGFNANKENFLVPVVLVNQLGYDALLFDFRAHGASGGRASTFGLEEAADVKAAHDWIRRTHPGRPVYALAYSMGASATVHAAAAHGLFERRVLDSTFGDLERVARATLLRPFGPLARPLWNVGRFWGWVWTGADVDRHRPERVIRALADRPLLLIHGTRDRLIPHTETLRLYEATGRRAELWLVPDGDHVQTVDHPEYRDRLRAFFAS